MPFPVVVSLRLLACSLITYFVWRWIGLVGLILCAPLFGVALAGPLQDAAANAVLLVKRLGYRRINGRHFEHRGVGLDIADDEAAYSWVRIDDARKIVAGLPDERVLERLFPGEVQLRPVVRVPRMKAEALDAYLSKSTEANALRFRRWLQREVILPAQKRRQRGLRLPHA